MTSISTLPRRNRALRVIKILHTIVWAFFAGSILAIPVFTWLGHWRAAWLLIGLVLIECLVLALNRMKCPLTGIAARYTDDRHDNFDIYLPLWRATTSTSSARCSPPPCCLRWPGGGGRHELLAGVE